MQLLAMVSQFDTYILAFFDTFLPFPCIFYCIFTIVRCTFISIPFYILKQDMTSNSVVIFSGVCCGWNRFWGLDGPKTKVAQNHLKHTSVFILSLTAILVILFVDTDHGFQISLMSKAGICESMGGDSWWS